MDTSCRCLTEPARLTALQTRRPADRPDGAAIRPAQHIKAGHLNVNHLMPSIDDVNLLLMDRDLDILCVGETFLNDKIDDRYLLFPGYVVERRDRQTHGGGVCVIYRNTLKGR